MQEEEGFVIEVKEAYKRYGTGSAVLQGFNMVVVEKTIYGLLGPSGCGKTTVLNCIASQQQLDAGSIKVNLDSKRQLGYMPQEIALLESFTTGEMLTYFGKLNGSSSEEITLRGRKLLALMDITVDSYWERKIGTLSGGQQRRVSLAVALIHSPKLLILDEPTVGLDPLISNRLWEYFLDITSQEGKTIIITTHYIEEARHSHMIGLMRNGVLLAEASPLQLLSTYKCDSLEEVFLMLSHSQAIASEDNAKDYPQAIKCNTPLPEGNLWNREKMAAQIYKNVCWAKRNIPIVTQPTINHQIVTAFCDTDNISDIKGISYLEIYSLSINAIHKAKIIRFMPCLVE